MNINLSLSFIPCVPSSLLQKSYLSREGSPVRSAPPPWLWKVCGRLEAEDSEAPPLHEFIEEVNAKALEAQREVSSFEGATEGEMALRWRQGGY